MNHSLPSDLLPRVRQLLMPFVSTLDEREALLVEAFYLVDPLLYRIKREGDPKTFSVMCIKTLLDHGCLADGEHALARLLATLRYDCGVDKHAEIDALVALTNALCDGKKPSASPIAAITSVATSEPVTTSPVTLETPREERRATVFISYSHRDTEFAQRLIADLNTAGHACWIDTSKIKGGDEWIMTIAEGINNSYAFVPIVTSKALESRWVQDEILWARQKNKLIIPVILENVLSETRFFPLVSYQGVTVFDSDYATILPKLLSYLPQPTLPEVSVSVTEAVVPTPATPREAVFSLRSVPRQLELDYLERLKFEELLNTEKYTAMGGVSHQKQGNAEIRAVFELLPLGKEPDTPAEPKRFENAVQEIQRLQRAVLLGEPGGGKTTTLWKLAADFVERALTGRNAPIPLLIRLGKWTDAEQSLPDFIASQLGALGAFLDALLRDKRAALLLDGLNELPTSQRDTKYPQVQQFIEQYPDLLAVVSCRELDYTLDLGFDRIHITPLDPLRIREFVTKYLGQEKGEALFWRIAGGDDVREVWAAWELAGATLDLFFNADDIPREIPNVYGATNSAQDGVWRDKVRNKHHSLMELAHNPYMLLMLTSVYAEEGELPTNRGQLFAKFAATLLERERVPSEEHPALLAGLARVAYEMQIRRAANDEGDALTVLPQDAVKTLLGERSLYLAGSASLLSVGEQVRFTHQLLQEYFAARYLDSEIQAGRLKASDLWDPAHWWKRTNWEEAVVLLAGLYTDDCTPILNWIANANPEVAAHCILRSGAQTPDATLLNLRDNWVPRLTDLQNDPSPLARAAVGRAVGQLRLSNGTLLDNRRGVGSIMTHQDVELPDIEWGHTIQPDTYYIGGDESAWRSLIGQEFELTYPYRLSKYPITNYQFALFVKNQYNNPVWWSSAGLDWKKDRQQPEEYTRQNFNIYNHPRIYVRWYEAEAFCSWLTTIYQQEGIISSSDTLRLPTQVEWEIAARGSMGWVFPYGRQFDPQVSNTREAGIMQTTAVGIFPDGTSPYNLHDMSGNVWEWCSSSRFSGDAWLEGDKERLVKGGSWLSSSHETRSASRNGYTPNSRDYDLGFRIAWITEKHK